MPEPVSEDGLLLVDALLMGVCGTDREIADGAFGRAPDGPASSRSSRANRFGAAVSMRPRVPGKGHLYRETI